MKATPSDKSITISRKRGHYNTACAVCHKRKIKCDGIKPLCEPCRHSGRQSECRWVRPKAKSSVDRIEVQRHPVEEEKLPEVHNEKYISIHHSDDRVSQ